MPHVDRVALVPSARHIELAGSLPGDARIALWEDLRAGRVRPELVQFVVIGGSLTDEIRDLLRTLPNLAAVRISSVGYDWLVDHLPPDVRLYNSADVIADTTAETGVLGILAAMRAFPEHMHAQRERRWITHTELGPTEHGVQGVVGSTILVLGQGPVGRGIADRLDAFKARVVRFARTARNGPQAARIHALSEVNEWLPQADAVSLALPLTSATRSLVDGSFLGRMKRGSVLGNVGRGGVVDTTALIAAVRAGHLRAALDVVDPEPLPAEHPIWDVPGISITPHTGGASRQVREDITGASARMAAAFLRGEDLGPGVS